jgi:hypothetical protein
VIDPSGDYRTLVAVLGAVALGQPVRARGEAVSDVGTLRAVEIRFEVDD